MAISSISQKNDAYSRLGFIRSVPSNAAMKSRKNTYSAESVVVDEITQANIVSNVQLDIPNVNNMTSSAAFSSPTKSKHTRTTTLPRSPAVTSFHHTVEDADSTKHDSAHNSAYETLDMSASLDPPSPSSHASNGLSPRTNMLSFSPSSSTGDSSPWIGGTGLGSSGLGKSGKVIERLMAECDRLKRELKSEIANREELQKAAQTHKERLESLREENSRLTNAKTMDDNMIKRRDRKIEELKAELHVEKQKRESLESRVEVAEKTQQEQEQNSNERLQRYLEEAKQASISAAIYQTSHKQLREEYQQRIATSHRSLKELYDKREEDFKEREQDRKKMVKIDVVNQQMAQELEKTRRAHNDLIAISEREREERAARVDAVLAETALYKENDQRRELEFEHKMAELQETLNHMKWVIAVKKVSDENGLHSPPPSPPG